MLGIKLLNSFHTTGLFLYPLQTSEEVFCFLEVKKETNGMKWVNEDSSHAPVIRQKGESQDGGSKKTKLTKCSQKQTSLTP